MGNRVGAFKSPEARTRFLDLYDRVVAELWPVPSVEVDVETRFGTTHVRRSGRGDGHPLVLLHGNSGTSAGWYDVVGLLAERQEVIAVDVIGALGRSEQTRPLESADDFSPWFRELLDGLGIERAHVIGYSEGGFIAFHAVRGNSDRVASMVALDAAGTVERIKLSFFASMFWAILMVAVRGPQALRSFGQKLTPGVEFPDVLWDMMTTGAKGFRPGVPMPRKVSDLHLNDLTVPILLYMAGQSEVYDARKAAVRARAHMPNAEVVVVEDAQHGLPFTHPEQTWGAVLEFVGRHDMRTQDMS